MLSKTIVKYIQSLSHKKFRDEDGVFVAEGSKVTAELLASRTIVCKIICATSNWFKENENLVKGVTHDKKIEVNDFELEKISQLQTPNGVLGVFYKKETGILELKNNISVMLDGIQDPGNMGTIIRTADWFNIKNIICSNDCVDCYNSKVVQATMGSLARLNIHYTDLEDFIHQNKNISIFAATLNGKNISALGKIEEGVILIGNESKGIKKNLIQLASQKITIPKYGEAESLNAGVAAGIILFHIVQGNTL